MGFRPMLRQHPVKERWLRCSIQIRFQPTEIVDQFRHVSNRKLGKFVESDDRNSYARVRFQTEGENRHPDKEDRHHGHNLQHKINTNTIGASPSVLRHRCIRFDLERVVYLRVYKDCIFIICIICASTSVQHRQCFTIRAAPSVQHHPCSNIPAAPSVHHHRSSCCTSLQQLGSDWLSHPTREIQSDRPRLSNV